jgi:hypothetical protein
VQYRKVGIEEQSDRLSDGREDIAGGRLLRDEYRHSAQRRLLLGQLAANGHVPRDAVEDAHVRQRARVPLEPAYRAVDADEAALESDDVLAGGQMDERVASALHIIRMHELQERPRHELLARVAQHALERRVQPLEVAVEAGDAEQVGREIEELAQLVIRRGHRHTGEYDSPRSQAGDPASSSTEAQPIAIRFPSANGTTGPGHCGAEAEGGARS